MVFGVVSDAVLCLTGSARLATEEEAVFTSVAASSSSGGIREPTGEVSYSHGSTLGIVESVPIWRDRQMEEL